eukprot:Sdes_comp20617_c0_seq1m15686
MLHSIYMYLYTQNVGVIVSAEGSCHIFDSDLLPSACPFIYQRVPVNVKSILIADVDGDGENELILGRTDRYVHVFKWETRKNSNPEQTTSCTDASLDASRSASRKSSPAAKAATVCGRLVELAKWDLGAQIGCLSIAYRLVSPHQRADKSSSESAVLLVAQPGGTYVEIDANQRGGPYGNLQGDCCSAEA